MRQVDDPVFGKLDFDNDWCRPFVIKFFGREQRCKLIVHGDESDEIELGQRQSFAEFDRAKHNLMETVPQAILSYYMTILPELRARYGESADVEAPTVVDPEQLEGTLNLKAVYVPYSFDRGKRVVSLLIDCSWMPEHGLAVRFVNEEVVEVGPQDIAL